MSYNIGPRIGIEGEDEYRRSLKEINTGIKTLGTEMKAVTSEFIGQEKSVESLSAENDVLDRTISSLNEKLELQKRMLQESADAYGEADEKTQKWQQTVNLTTAELNNAKAKIAENEKAMQGLSEEVDEAAESTSTFSDVFKANLLSDAVMSGIKGFASAVKEIGSAMLDIAKAGAEYADEILTMSSVTGLSTEALQEYKYMADLVDVSVDTITGSITKLTRNMKSARDGTGAQAEAFEKLGIKVVDADGNLRDAREVFDEVIDALGKMENETERDAVAMELMGKSAQDLNPLIEAGSEKIAAFRQEAHDMGAVLNDETLGTLGEVQDGFDRLSQKATASKNQLATTFAPAIIKICNDLIDAWDKVTNAVIRAYEWLNKPIGNKTPSTQPGNYSNITGKYFDPDEEYYGTNNSYLDDLMKGRTSSSQSTTSRAGSASNSGTGTQIIEVHTTMQMDKQVVGEAVTQYQVQEARKRG